MPCHILLFRSTEFFSNRSPAPLLFRNYLPGDERATTSSPRLMGTVHKTIYVYFKTQLRAYRLESWSGIQLHCSVLVYSCFFRIDRQHYYYNTDHRVSLEMFKGIMFVKMSVGTSGKITRINVDKISAPTAECVDGITHG